MRGKRILLVVAGGIAAYKTLEVIRRLRDAGVSVRCILTRAGSQFVTPLSLAALTGEPVHEDLFSLTGETEMGHIRLSREADLVVVAPATADLMAKMAGGHANDLASTALLATDKPVLLCPAMNPAMWSHPATRANVVLLESRGIHRVGPNPGDMACGEEGEGRLAEPAEILAAINRLLTMAPPGSESVGGGSLAGRHALVTSGPTHEPIDPVRYIANRSSGKQGHAIAAALANLGARVTLVSGPVHEPDPPGVLVVRVTTARDMLAACEAALPADLAVCAAAVADWAVDGPALQKMKKTPGGAPPTIALRPNPDILATLSATGPHRPTLVVGFAAETERVVEHARDKRRRKGCDWILANDVSANGNQGRGGAFGASENTVHLITDDGAVEEWPTMDKDQVAERLAERLADHLARLRRDTSGRPENPGGPIFP
ncbi:MAG: bifunctional phosphopantothenoylcysteine decarboxylase/phosphopantothenate--cysteine ligase CoaBC [Rhodospirillum sp.]|nr:bifunctional phosphopantothenoylcysteine decarboxylase/phosphopantothenate--cysteine ligase CoaBC [Rhodospirillum sp.]MCF8487579.1 bifunctional phosphopantothenoylcysteine decarboxylase/phosphopantothenate--cysteine ligase CoaBC [Rhodospirillum sp.]MCF8500234.1 bifunctional phosphopantothenoylcysteine decarboxylase/phosphopantothenate--cysteine ligase CoaBC [Rhodospirillum sp.]